MKQSMLYLRDSPSETTISSMSESMSAPTGSEILLETDGLALTGAEA